MMVIRPVERSDVSALMQLASKTGGGLTSLPANEATLSARIERAIKTWQGELPKSERAMCSCWKIARQAPWRGFVPLRWRLG
ncbi:arginine N-succinyltransferase [Escherichia coli]